ncbi:MAG: ribonuclease HII [Candidatus Pacebacteria bacterium]|nr:ribonuclease HII [Candidatus Paceibacterota bacterium]
MTIQAEKALWKRGYKIVVGIDEAGRGPLAGPVVAGAFALLPKNINKSLFSLIKDSKQLSEKKREEAFAAILKEKNLIFGVGKVSEKIIDSINIFEATKMAMKRAVASLIKKTGLRPDILIIDGKHGINLPIEQKTIVKADTKIFSCSAASIIAKVTRDRLMEKLDKKYIRYGFGTHKGYGTKAHFAAIKKYGCCEIHRKSFNLHQ